MTREFTIQCRNLRRKLTLKRRKLNALLSFLSLLSGIFSLQDLRQIVMDYAIISNSVISAIVTDLRNKFLTIIELNDDTVIKLRAIGWPIALIEPKLWYSCAEETYRRYPLLPFWLDCTAIDVFVTLMNIGGNLVMSFCVFIQPIAPNLLQLLQNGSIVFFYKIKSTMWL